MIERRRRRALDSSLRVTRTIFGEIHCTVTTYRTGQVYLDSDLDEAQSEEDLEIETCFSVVPSWWVVRFGIVKVYKLDVLQLSNQGWQTKLASFNVSWNSSVFPYQILRRGTDIF